MGTLGMSHCAAEGKQVAAERLRRMSTDGQWGVRYTIFYRISERNAALEF